MDKIRTADFGNEVCAVENGQGSGARHKLRPGLRLPRAHAC